MGYKWLEMHQQTVLQMVISQVCQQAVTLAYSFYHPIAIDESVIKVFDNH